MSRADYAYSGQQYDNGGYYVNQQAPEGQWNGAAPPPQASPASRQNSEETRYVPPHLRGAGAVPDVQGGGPQPPLMPAPEGWGQQPPQNWARGGGRGVPFDPRGGAMRKSQSFAGGVQGYGSNGDGWGGPQMPPPQFDYNQQAQVAGRGRAGFGPPSAGGQVDMGGGGGNWQQPRGGAFVPRGGGRGMGPPPPMQRRPEEYGNRGGAGGVSAGGPPRPQYQGRYSYDRR